MATRKYKSNLLKLREIVRGHQFQKIHGSIVDPTTARAILNVHDALKFANKIVFRKMIEKDIAKASRVAWKLHK